MTQHDGGPAFPRLATQYIPQGPLTTASAGWGGGGSTSTHDPGHAGMSLRDWFAGQALAGMSLRHGVDFTKTDRSCGYDVDAAMWAADQAYLIADAMLKAREAKP